MWGLLALHKRVITLSLLCGRLVYWWWRHQAAQGDVGHRFSWRYALWAGLVCRLLCCRSLLVECAQSACWWLLV